MGASSARMIGTAKITQPCRSTAMKSRSGKLQQVKYPLQSAIDILTDRDKAWWRPCRVYRGQDRLSADSVLQVHGFVMLEIVRYRSDTIIVVLSILAGLVACLPVAALCGPGEALLAFLTASTFAGDLVKRSEDRIRRVIGADPRYIRLDWGEDGLVLQQQRHMNDFVRYMDDLNKETEELLNSRLALAPVVGSAPPVVATGAYMCSGLTLAEAAAAADMVCATVLAAGFLAVACVGACVGVAGAIEMCRRSAPTNTWVPTKKGATLGEIALALKSKDKPYDIRTWNCNHLADTICDAILLKQVEVAG